MNNLSIDSSIVKYIFRSAIINDTLLENHFRYILYRCRYNRNIYEQGIINADSVYSKLIADWNYSCKNDKIRLGSNTNELVQRRDTLEPWILTKEETHSVIEMLAISKYLYI